MKNNDLIYIGIGASAGGLEALQNLVNPRLCNRKISI